MAAVQQPVLLTEISDGLARVTINRPERMNSLSRELMAALRRAFFELAEDRDTRVILLSAAGDKAFCAGADLKEPGRHHYADLSDYLAGQPAVFDMMRHCPQVIVSAVNGWAVGGGMQLALFSDLIYASSTASFSLPQVGLGIMAPYGTGVRLARFIGQGRAMQMLLLGAKVGAEQAQQWGLVQDVAPDRAALMELVEGVVQSLLKLPPESLQLTKDSLATGWETSAEGIAAADRFRDYALKQSAEAKKIHQERLTST
jgi:enoyl-CoA hydratase/carnithine racemase